MAAPNNMHNLTTLIKRLEAATSRLEDIATSTELPKDVPALINSTSASAAAADASAPVPASSAPKSLPKVASEPLPESVEEFDAYLKSTVEKYVNISKEIGGTVAKQAAEVLKGFQEQRKLILISTKAKKPDMSGLQSLTQPINSAVMAVMDIKDSSRGDPLSNHLTAVSDGIMVMGWVTLDNRPFKHVDESLGSAQFFGNKVLKEYKEKDPKHVEWVQSFYAVFKDLSELVKENFTNGLPWNPKGEPAANVSKALAAQSAPPSTSALAGGAPPPPPPPPPGPPPILDIKTEVSAPTPSTSSSGFGAVFSDLNKGEDVTKGLRKVDKSQMTHKNPSLRAGSTVADSSSAVRGKSPAPGKKPKPESMRVKKPAKKELEGNKWTVENYEKESGPVEIEASLTHSILISRCNSATVIIKGKANQVTVENSNRLSLVVDTLVSTVDVVKAPNFALQVLGTIPTIMLDQVDGGTIYLSKESTRTQIFTSKSAGINLNIISGPDEDYKEVPLPSQISSYYDEEKGDLINEIVAHAG
ncbi:adenylyl cyclase-associated protein [Geosmithia morbida]|uniref:Adenylyl cyclase-associated protein n=1 Tax=Geosmithia morbida TaxID=1094350 RepID=A0A9P4Z0S5_9HYPO|nr:adenylyl cyclase-associated protein [Geosmithia morbida]KAF4125321.1 adenylyl cyclase-associated protein [Geosmithia morbida]